ncbi:MAG: DUF4910 domain-containing protein [Lachnospiraceae bacterium]|nr:DUF4910 domain-containing protein [Lachnospiraceae bacterium]
MSDRNNAGKRMYEFAGKIFPLFRSITGEGVRKTLKLIADETGADMKILEVPSGTKVFDWTVPPEWVIREAYIENEDHKRIIDAKENNLHVLGYSTPVDRWVELEELKEFVYTEPSQPEVIPYVTSYYRERYGFCMSENLLRSLPDGRYHMVIDSELIQGSLSIGEVVIPGKSEKEIFFSTYVCHPSMADNECSGPALAAELIRFVSSLEDREYTYRFVFLPETIGSITYLATDGRLALLKERMKAGFVLSCVGDDLAYSMVGSRYGKTLADRALKCVLKGRGEFRDYSFRDRGSDERQYNAPGIDLPVVAFCRSKYGTFPEYHTSADNMDFVSPEGFQGSFDVMSEVIEGLEKNGCYRINVLGEPQLGKRGLYSTISRKGIYDRILVQRDVIAYCDGRNDLFDLSERIGAPLSHILEIVEELLEHNLLDKDEREGE